MPLEHVVALLLIYLAVGNILIRQAAKEYGTPPLLVGIIANLVWPIMMLLYFIFSPDSKFLFRISKFFFGSKPEIKED